jgi:hypothetical protein
VLNVRRSLAASSCSWIDSATGLPETDPISVIQPTKPRTFLTGNLGFRFSNFMEVWGIYDDTKKQIINYGFTEASKLYRGPSYAKLPSHAFSVTQETFIEEDGIRFTQIVGARTVSPEVLGAGGGGVVGLGIGLIAAPFLALPLLLAGGLSGATAGHQIMGFPPIWSKIQIRLYSNGDSTAELLQFSIFPSLTFYTSIASTDSPSTEFTLVGRASQKWYNASKDVQLPDWQSRGWGNLAASTTSGPTAGNPWGIRKGLIGGRENVPN